MKRIAFLVLVMLIIAGGLIGCTSKGISMDAPTEPSQISISIDNQAVDYINSDAVESPFLTIMSEDSNIEVPYIKLGEIVVIDFGDASPDTIEIYDNLIDKYGNNRYTYREIKEIPVELENGKCSFELKIHGASLLSSNSDDYQPGNTYRGFRIVCSWGESEREYSFVIRSDAFSR